MRILHLNSSFSSVSTLAEFQRKLGHTVHIATYSQGYWDMEYDYLLQSATVPKTLYRFHSLASKYDILHFHYHSALSIGFRYADLPIWRALGKTVVLHYRGDDVRGKPHILPRLFASAILASTPDLLEFEHKAQWIPNPIDMRLYPLPAHTKNNNPIRIVHAPSDRARKGTHFVLEACLNLQRKGIPIVLDLVEGTSHNKAVQTYAQADIAVDQLCVGWYGDFALECMALGKPVLCYISPETKEHHKEDCPVAISHDSLEQSLTELISNPDRRKAIGLKSRQYVAEFHDAEKIAHRVCQTYKKGIA